ncbi:MAG TPA: class I SAM-dependent methyltransferase [Candidatus Binatia bacterium]|nr:class I SAM-dependent methyltransferase [Candidatus Binatia bacterium]
MRKQTIRALRAVQQLPHPVAAEPTRLSPCDELRDLAGENHWDLTYASRHESVRDWEPKMYEDRAISNAFDMALNGRRPASIFEIGCGDSHWLPYLGKRYTASRVSGVDYSSRGCELARARLKAAGISGTVYESDLFKLSPKVTGQFDLVFSLGVVEHFSDLNTVLTRIASFVAPEGVLVTEVPNLCSIHGLMTWVWQPEVFRKHKIVRERDINSIYSAMGFVDVHSTKVGLFSLSVPAWPLNYRWPRLQRRLLPRILRATTLTSTVLNRVGVYRGFPFFAPYIMSWAQRREIVRH